MIELINGRTKDDRNFAGGVIGGVLGILVCGYIHPMLTWLGALGGFFAGYYYEELERLVVEYSKYTIRRTRARWRLYTRMPRYARKALASRLGRIDHYGLPPLIGWATYIAFLPVRFSRRMYHWFADRETRVTAVRTAATVTFFASLGALVYINWGYFKPMILPPTPEPNSSEELAVVGKLLGSVMSIAMLAITPIFSWSEPPTSSQKQLWISDYKFSAKYGRMALFAKNLGRLVATAALTVSYAWLLGFGGFSYLAITGSLYVVFGLVPLLAFAGIVRGIAQLATRRQHWLGAGVTTIITIASAWVFNPYFESTIVIWLTAFGTGALAGYASREAANAIEAVYQSSDKLQELAKRPLKEHIAPANTAFVTVGKSTLGTIEWLVKSTHKKVASFK